MVGVIVNSLESSQLAFLAIKQGNHLVNQGQDFVIFQENIYLPCVKPMFAVMNTAEIWNFRGTLIATNLAHAAQLVFVKNHIKKIFYVWDLEWMRGQKDFLYNIKTYRNPELTLICRSNEHAKHIKNYCNRESYVIEDFDLVEIMKVPYNNTVKKDDK